MSTTNLQPISPQERLDRIREAVSLLMALGWDLGGPEESAQNLVQNPRNRTRSVCAVAEGLASVLRQIVLLIPDMESKITPRVLASLRRGPGKRSDPIAALRFTLDVASKVLELTPRTGREHRGERGDLKLLFGIRDRITHPKTAADMASANPFLTERVRAWIAEILAKAARPLGNLPFRETEVTSSVDP